MKVWKKARLVKGWQKIRGAERNRKEKAGKRKMYETPTTRGRKKTYTSGTQVNFYKGGWSRLEVAIMWQTGEETGNRGHSCL